jgi:two-component system chemotaxis response regulator CheY
MSKALIVDDSKTIRVILRRIMMEIGYEICEAANGREALQVMEAEKNSVTVVLADWNMPEVNGFELLQQLRRRSELSAVKIIMVTTEAELGHMASALEAGADEYVMKPFTRDIIRDKLDLVGVLPQVSA